MIEFHCKNCGLKVNVQDQFSGKRVKCPKCSSVGFVPDNSVKVKFHCENCGQSISVPQIRAGKKGKCPKCKNVVVIPTREATPAKSTSMVSFTCSMCDEVVQVTEPSIGKTIECPKCGSYIETASGGARGESDVSAHEDLYEEGDEEHEESEGVDKRIIVGISAVAAVVVVGLIIFAAILRFSGSRPAGRPERLRTQRQVTDTDSPPRPVTSDTQPEEPVEAVPLPKPGEVVANSIGMKLVYIPAGSFMMGSGDSVAQLAKEYNKDESEFTDEFPQHQVRISEGFWMGQTEVTQGQYKSVMNAEPWSRYPFVQKSANNPAVWVTWENAAEFCRKLSQREGKTYRLPTEAEWEYACRAGTTTQFSFGDSDSSLGDYGGFAGNAPQQYAYREGQKKPNPWGLYDMNGNVWEWCSDYYDKDYYSISPSVDPKGPLNETRSSHSLRGVFLESDASYFRPSDRRGSGIVNRSSFIGFRVVRSQPGINVEPDGGHEKPKVVAEEPVEATLHPKLGDIVTHSIKNDNIVGKWQNEELIIWVFHNNGIFELLDPDGNPIPFVDDDHIALVGEKKPIMTWEAITEVKPNQLYITMTVRNESKRMPLGIYKIENNKLILGCPSEMSKMPKDFSGNVMIFERIEKEPSYPPVEPIREPERPEAAVQEPAGAVALPKLGDIVTNSIGMKLVYIPAGSFMMGSGDSAAQLAKEYRRIEASFGDEFTQHQVRISEGFWMGQTEVTQGQYKSVMGGQPWSGQGKVKEGPNYPAVYVSWVNAAEFCRKLSEMEGKTYRLPTEAEWEYACRAGTTTRFSFGDSDSSLGDYGWFAGNTPQQCAYPIGQKKPNPWNLYDMHGNVWEWCSDWYGRDYYSISPSVDPKGPPTGIWRSLRGGSWNYDELDLRCAVRSFNDPGDRYVFVGFRVVRSQP